VKATKKKRIRKREKNEIDTTSTQKSTDKKNTHIKALEVLSSRMKGGKTAADGARHESAKLLRKGLIREEQRNSSED